MPQTPEWLSMRRFDPARTARPVVIGASEAAAACGRSSYCSPLELYLVKRGEYEQERTSEQIEAMEMGTYLEPLILDRYERRTGYTLDRNLPMFFADLHPWMAATPDGMVSGDNGYERSVDAKATSGHRFDRTGENISSFGAEGTDQVPIDYLFQGQQQCLVMGVDVVDFPVLFDSRTLRIYTVQRDSQIIAEMVSAEYELCERIIDGDPPEPSWEHSGTLKVIQSLYGTLPGKVITWGATEAELWSEDQRLAKEEKAIKSAREAVKAKLMAAMGDAEEAHFGQTKLKKVKVAAYEYTARNPGYVKLSASRLK